MSSSLSVSAPVPDDPITDAPPLTGLDVFVGGPIQHALGQGAFDDALRERLVTTIDTVRRHGAEVFSAHSAERFGALTPEFSPEEVSLRDYRWMSKCDVFVPVLPVGGGRLMRTDGTHIELGWASATGTPIVVATDLPLHESASHLLKGLGRVGTVAFVDVAEVTQEPRRLVRAIHEVTAARREALAVLAR